MVVDGNWLLMRTINAINDDETSSDEEYAYTLKQALHSFVIRTFSLLRATKLCFVKDNHTWRTSVPRPHNQDVKYKKQRVRETKYRWDIIWQTFEDYMSSVSAYVPVVSAWMAEGDDMVRAVVDKINNSNNNAIIVSTDRDLSQLLKCNPFVAQYAGKKLLTCKEYSAGFLIAPPSKIRLNQQVITEEIQPNHVVMVKVISGDTSDNISPVYQNKITRRKSSERYALKLIDDLSLTRPTDIMTRIDDIVEYISSSNITNKDTPIREDIRANIIYNYKLVYLSPEVIPGDCESRIQEAISELFTHTNDITQYSL